MARRAVRIKPKFYVILTLALGVAVTVLALVLKDRAGGTLKTGSMEAVIEKKAVLIRDEMSISVDKYDRVRFLVKEGQDVYESTPVAEVYKWGYSDDMTQSLLSVESQIYSAQKSQLSGVENAELSSIELQVEQKRTSIRAAVGGNSGEDVLALQWELEALMKQRAEFLKQTVQPTEELTALYSTVEERSIQLSSYKTDITAARDGRVSFYFDGFEQALNRDKLDDVNAALISATASAAVDSLGGSSNDLLYRLVNPSLWNVAFVTGKSDPVSLAQGESYTLSFEGYEGREYAAVAMELMTSDAGTLNLLEVSEDMGPLINSRTINVSVRATLTGLVVPLDAISAKDGARLVTIEGADGEYTVEVDVIAADEDNALVRARDGSGALSEGMRYAKP